MKKNKQFKGIIIILSLIIFVLFGAYYFLYLEIKQKNENIAILQSNLSMQDNKQEYVLSTQRILQNMKLDIDNINSSIVSKEGDVGFIEGLESLARENNIKITIDSLLFEDQAAFNPAAVTSLRVKAKIEGDWSGVYTFLSELESLPYKVKMDKVSIENGDAEADLSVVTPSTGWQGFFELHVLKYK